MIDEKVRNIGLVAVGVIVVGVILFSSAKKDLNNVVENPALEEVPVQEPTPNPQISSPEASGTQSVSSSEKFNTAIATAQAAFLKNDYSRAISYYTEAITYKKDAVAYAGLYTVYLTQKNWAAALIAIDQAIKIDPLPSDYWNWKLLVLNEGLSKSFIVLQAVYEEGLTKVKSEEKINLITNFARIAGSKGGKTAAISLWQKAIELNPSMKAAYQAEIDILNK